MVDQESIKGIKRALYCLTLISIVVQIGLVVLAFKTIDELENDNGASEEKFAQAKKIVKYIFSGYCVAVILFNLVGLFGMYYQNYCLSLTYAILMSMTTCAGIKLAMQSPIGWAIFIYYIVITVIAYRFARHIKSMRINQEIHQAQQTACLELGNPPQQKGSGGPVQVL